MYSPIKIPLSAKIVPAAIGKITHETQSKLKHHLLHSPTWMFSDATNNLKVLGRSTSLFSQSTFSELSDMVADHFLYRDDLTIEITLDLINSASIKSLLNLVTLLNSHHRMGKSIEIKWNVSADDDDMFDIAEDLQFYAEFPFLISC